MIFLGKGVGACGTIYIEDRTQNTQTLVIDNGGNSGGTAVISESTQYWAFSTISIKGYGVVTFVDISDFVELNQTTCVGDFSGSLYQRMINN